MGAIKDYVGIATKYAEDIVAGKAVGCKWVRLACKRYLDDLSNKGFPYYLDKTAVLKVCYFLEKQKHLKGPQAGQYFDMSPWQVFVLVNIFGWLHKSGPKANKRRYRKAYLELPRGNGKSFLASALSLYMLGADGEGGPEVYSAATSREQARVVFDSSLAMARSMPQSLINLTGIEPHAHTITAKSNGKFKPLSAKGNTLHGLNIHFCVIDELHVHTSDEVWNIVTHGAGKRDQSLIMAITTAGSDVAGICYAQHKYVTQILEKSFTDETYFGVIWTIDDDDNWMDEAAWAKANPEFGNAVDIEDLRSNFTQASSGDKVSQFGFKTMRLNVWEKSASHFFDTPSWQSCMDSTLDIKDFAGEKCWIGLDLAFKTDLVAMSYLFKRDKKIYIFMQYYLPEKAISQGKNPSYKKWASDGLIKVADGEAIHIDAVQDDILEAFTKYDIQAVMLDPWQVMQLAQQLQTKVSSEKIQLLPQITRNLSAPLKELDYLSRTNGLVYNCPILYWMSTNLVVTYDHKQNIFPKKERVEDKIDGISAIITALWPLMTKEEKVEWSAEDYDNFDWFK
jgi:phage terminase large subunit-like protein